MSINHREGFARADRAGFRFWGEPRKWIHTRRDDRTGQPYVANMRELAQDAALITAPGVTVPAELTAYVDTEVTEILTAPRAATELFPEERKGTWANAYNKWRVRELTGVTEPYSDSSHAGVSGVNAEWATRAQYLFQTTISAGDLEVAMSAEARINLLAEKQRAAATALALDANAFYLRGVAGLPIYGVLNDPNLPEAVAASPSGTGNSTKWADKNADQIYGDVLDLFRELASNSRGLIRPSDPLRLAVSPGGNVSLGRAGEHGKTVLDLLRQYFPALTVVVIPELESDAENTVLMTAPVVMGQQTAVLACSEKLRTGRVVPDLSSVSQKWVSTTYGAIVKLPFAIAQMTGV